MTQDAANDAKRRVALVSLLAALALTAVKLAVGVYTNSLGILSEALHSGLDLLATGLTLLAVHVAARPADEGHAYGHGKAENLSALAQTLLLFLTCGWVVWEGAHRLMEGASPMRPSLWGVGVMLFSMIVDINRVRVLRRVARESQSQALEADALHFSTDILSSAVVLAGVLAAWLVEMLRVPAPLARVLAQADTVAALLVAVIMFTAGVRMAAAAVNTLMDAAPPAAAAAIRTAVLAVPGVVDMHGLRVRRSGAQHFVELCLGVLSRQRVEEAHTLAHAAEEAVRAVLPGADVIVHVEPRTMPAGSDPFVLTRAAAAAHGLRVHSIHVFGEDRPCHLELHAELPADMDFATAHARVTAFEVALEAQLPGVNIVSRLEPDAPRETGFAPVSLSWGELLRREALRAAEKEPLAREPHDFSMFEIPEAGTCFSFHCIVARGLTVAQAHAVSARLEQALRLAVPRLGRVNIHLEPEDGAAETEAKQGPRRTPRCGPRQ